METNKHGKESEKQHHEPHHTVKNDEVNISAETILTLLIVVVATLLFYNQWQIYELNNMKTPTGASISGTTGLSGIDSYSTLGPMLLDAGEQPAVPGYKTKFKKLPTISAHEIPASTGDAVQDAINQLIATGTPDYGAAAGVSFDDPVPSLTKWSTYDKLTLSGADLERYNRIVNAYTCDYCCGSPKSPTVITRCGCAHAKAWRGAAKWFIQNYGNEVTDLQIVGELTRWKTLWYPGPTVKRIFEEQSVGSGDTSAATSISSLPSMVGGC